MSSTYVRRPEVPADVADELGTLAEQIEMLETALEAKRARRNDLLLAEIDRGVMMAPLGRVARLNRRTVMLINKQWRKR